MLTDTHTHLYSEAFDEDRPKMIRRALEAGVDKFFIPAIDSTYIERMYDLERAFPDHMHLMMGLHPTSVKPETFERELKIVEEQFEKRDFCAVGEIGIDLYWDSSTLEIQKEAFSRQIKLAKGKKLPIVIHCREAFDEIFEVLEEEGREGLRGIFHCFTGTREQAQKALSFNMKLGIGGVVTFKNGKIDRFLSEIPVEQLVLETDAPYLAPVPYRGKRNESAYITEVCEKVASLYGFTFREMARITTANAKEVFGV
jgi:TatD DNase family protein